MEKKKLLFIGIITTAVAVGIYLLAIDNMNKFESLKEHGNKIAMYIENDDGEYIASTNSAFPTDGYVLNAEKSSCQNGGKPSQDATTKAISLSTSVAESCTLYFEKETLMTLANGLKSNISSITDYNSGNKGEMFAFSHEATTQTPAQTDYRYIGNTPNNYVTFNGETWRIIGVFETENSAGVMEQRIKIVRQETLGDLAWNSSASNEWSTASLKTLLNGDYYNRTGSYASTGLSEVARNMIEPAKWYLGGSSTYSNLGGTDYYNFERGTTVYSGHTTNIVQNVGLIYPSDYVYTYANGVDSKCYTDGFNCNTSTPASGWMFTMLGGAAQWTAAPSSGSMPNAFYILPSGSPSSRYPGGGGGSRVTNTYGVRPVVYLKSSVKLAGGDGSEGNPYTLA